MKTKKIRFKLVMILVGALFLMGFSTAQAAPTVRLDPSNNFVALGIDNLNVNGTLYNVDFIFTDADQLYGSSGNKVFDFTSDAAANSAVDAAVAALNDYNGTSLFDVMLVGNRKPNEDNFFIVGYNEDGGRTDYIQGFYSTDTWVNDQPGDRLSFVNATYADFNAVPIPGAVWLLGGGLIGLAGLRRRFKK